MTLLSIYVCHVALSLVWQHVTEFVELLTTFLEQADYKLRRQFKTATFRRYIYVIAFLRATSTAMVIPGRENDRISAQTVRNRLADYVIGASHPYIGLRLTPPCQRYRSHWAHQHLRWTQNQWNNVLFSDKSRFCLHRANGA